MLTDEAIGTLVAFKARKAEQAARAAALMPRLQIIASGERQSQIMIACSTDAFSEGVVIGQLPHVVMEVVGSRKNPVRRAASNENKPHEKRAIDLTDEQIDAVLALWRVGQSALGLPFVSHVYDARGKISTK